MNLKAMLDTIYDDDCQVPCITIKFSGVPCGNEDEQIKTVLDFIAVRSYNDFPGKKVVAFLKSAIKRKELAEFRFGREYSPVVYFEPSHWNKPKDKKCTKKEYKAVCEQFMEKVKLALKPDELHLNGEIRAWWD